MQLKAANKGGVDRPLPSGTNPFFQNFKLALLDVGLR